MKLLVGVLILFVLTIETAQCSEEKPKYDNESFKTILNEIVAGTEKIEKYDLLAWNKFINRKNIPIAEKILTYVISTKNNKKYYYLIVMERSLKKGPQDWSIDFLEIEFHVFKPYRKYDKTPKNDDIYKLLKYASWMWDGRRCRWGIVGQVDVKNWSDFVGEEPQYTFSNKGFVCN